MSRYLFFYKDVKHNFRDNLEEINAITFTLHHFREIKYTCNVGMDFRDHWNDLRRRRIELMGFDDGIFELKN